MKTKYLKTGPGEYIVRIPWVTTSGRPGSPCAYNNSVHAAVHSLLAALGCTRINDVRWWLDVAGRQIRSAQMKANSKEARVPKSE